MKVLLTSYWSVPVAGELFTYVKTLMRGLEQSGIEVDVLTRDPEFKHYYLLKDGRSVPIQTIKDSIQSKVEQYYHFRFTGIDHLIVYWETERYSFEAAATLFDLPSYDLIHAQEIISARAMYRVKQQTTPLVSTIHGCWPLEAISIGYVKDKESSTHMYNVFQDRLGVRSCDQTIIPTHWLKNIMVDELGVPSENMTVIPFGLDLRAFQTDMDRNIQRPTPDDGRKVILCSAMFHKDKGHRTLLEALAKLKNDRDDWVCWLVGNGDLREELERLCGQLNLEQQVRFLGKRDDVPALLRMADFCVYPSLADNLPYAVMEAQAAGKAVIASDVGGIPELVKHKETGLLVPAGDAEELRSRMKKLLRQDELRQKFGRTAQQWATQHLSLNQMMQRTFTTYQAAEAKHGRKSET